MNGVVGDQGLTESDVPARTKSSETGSGCGSSSSTVENETAHCSTSNQLVTKSAHNVAAHPEFADHGSDAGQSMQMPIIIYEK